MPHWYCPAQSVSEKARLRRRAFLADFAETMTTMRSQVRLRRWIDIEQGAARDAPCITVLLGNECWPRVPRALCVGAGRSTIALELRRLVAISSFPLVASAQKRKRPASLQALQFLAPEVGLEPTTP